MIPRVERLGNQFDPHAMDVTAAHPSARRFIVRQRLWPAVLVLSALAAAVVAFVEVPAFVRFPIALWFVAVCPGMAITGLTGVRDPVAKWTLAGATSFAVGILIASASIYLGLWSPTGILFALMLITLAGAAGQVFGPAIIPRRLRHLVERRPGAGSGSAHLAQPRSTTAAMMAPNVATQPRRFETDLADHEWEIVAPLLPPRQPFHKYDPRDLCNAIRYAERVDVPWEALPNDFPPGRTVARYYRHLLKTGIWQQISQTLGEDNALSLGQEAGFWRADSLTDSTTAKRLWPRGSSRKHRVRRVQR
jgi:transposase